MGWRGLAVLVALTGCVSPFERDGDIIDLAPDAGLRDGEMEEHVAQEHCYRWICPVGFVGVKRVSCGGLDEYYCE
jgi:hypothetical protein